MVVPAILAKSREEFEKKVRLVAPYTDTIQIDVMDGHFVPNITWAETDIIEHLHLPLRFEAHLMVKDPEEDGIEEWARAGAFRIIFHLEATKKAGECIKKIKKFKREVGVAINPPTSLKKIEPFLKKIDYVLVMGVKPGASGQKFQPRVLEKIKKLKKIAPNVKIGVDGGVNIANARKIYAAGADYLCAASSIFKNKNIAKAIEELNNK